MAVGHSLAAHWAVVDRAAEEKAVVEKAVADKAAPGIAEVDSLVVGQVVGVVLHNSVGLEVVYVPYP